MRNNTLSKGQEAPYHVHRMAPESPAYNLGFSFVIHGKINIPAMRRTLQALQALIRRHASLRESFAMGKDGELSQRIHPDPRANFEHTDASAWDEAGRTLVSINGDHHNFKNTKSRYVITIVHPQKDIPVGQAIATVKKIKLELK